MELELPWAAEKVDCSRTGHVDAQPAPQSSLGVGGGGVRWSRARELSSLSWTDREGLGRVRSRALSLALSSL